MERGGIFVGQSLSEPWGREFVFQSWGEEEIRVNISSKGADGRAGGSGPDEDYVLADR